MSPLITRIDDLRALYGPARERSVKKELPQLDAHAMRFIGLAPLVVLASRGPGGDMDASPRGGEPGFVKVVDAGTLLIPDAPGNNRLDTLENIIQTASTAAPCCPPTRPRGSAAPMRAACPRW